MKAIPKTNNFVEKIEDLNNFCTWDILVANSEAHVRQAILQLKCSNLVVVTWKRNLPNKLSNDNFNLVYIEYSFFLQISHLLNPSVLYLVHILSYLAKEEDVQALLVKCSSITKDFLMIRDNYYDSDYELNKMGFKTLSSNLSSNKVRLKVDHYLHLLNKLDILSYSLFGLGRIFSTKDKYILPLNSPKDFRLSYNQEVTHKISQEKPDLEIEFLSYRFVHLICNLSYRKEIPIVLDNNISLLRLYNLKAVNKSLIESIKELPSLEISKHLHNVDLLKAYRINVNIIEDRYKFTSTNNINVDCSVLQAKSCSRDFNVPSVYVAELENCLLCPPFSGIVSANKTIVKESLYLSSKERLLRNLLRMRQSYPHLSFDSSNRVSEKAYYLLANSVCKNYFHWNIQCLTSCSLLELLPSLNDICLLGPPLNAWKKRSLELAGFSDYRYQEISELPQTIEKLLYPSLLSGEYIYHPWHGIKRIFQRIKDNVISSALTTTQESMLLYVARFDSNRRTVLNENELAAQLSSIGFSVVVPSELSLDEQVLIFSRARVVVAPHGAGITNIVYCRPGTVLYELLPRSYQNMCFFKLAQVFEIAYWADTFNLEEEVTVELEDGAVNHNINWRVDIDTVLEKVKTILETTT